MGSTRASLQAMWLAAASLLASCGACSRCTGSSRITGVVVDARGRPVASARVRVQATAISTVTGKDGAFTLSAPADTRDTALAAWKEGFVNGGERLAAGRTSYRIILKPIPEGDDPGYAWKPPRTPKATPAAPACEHCHPEIVAEWERSSHATSARNPLFLAALSGKGPDGHATGGPAYRLDFPRSAGSCAACHVPALALAAPFGADPAEARGAAAAGIFCDFCHKVRDTAADESGGRPGILSIRLARPAPGDDVFFGQLDDVIAGPDSRLPLYGESRYCAPCHHGTFWRVRAYSEFTEWAASSYSRRGIHCQSCHMKLRSGARRFAIAEEGGRLRPAEGLSSHVQFGLNDEEFMRQSVKLSVRAEMRGERLGVAVSVRNVGAGHHIPTGSPMRNMILLVEARDASGRLLPLLEGSRVPDWAGRGSPARGDYAGLPGKGFAKLLTDLREYPSNPLLGRQLDRFAPAPYWRPTVVVSDNRIAAEAADESRYVFAATSAHTRGVMVQARLVYRRTFRSWTALDRIKPGELELARLTTRPAG